MKKIFFENLDGLRFIAFFSIFLRHSFYTEEAEVLDSTLYGIINFLRSPSSLGVPFFFCLSGFLITYLLLVEQDYKGKINIRNFYIRRILRIWPLYYAVVIFGFFIFPVVRGLFIPEPYVETATLWKYLAFLSNFDQLENGAPYGAGLSVTWSLSVEEQFYLAWPLILSLVPKKWYSVLTLSLFVISQILLYQFGFKYTHTLGSMSDLSIGAFLAVLWFNKNRYLVRSSKMSTYHIYTIYILGFVSLYSFSYFAVGNRALISLFMAFVIYDQCFCENSVFKMGRFRIISKLGTMTYGFYLLHTICNFVIHNIFEMNVFSAYNSYLTDVILQPVLSFALTTLVGFLSYNYFEKPFLNLKRKFSLIQTT